MVGAVVVNNDFKNILEPLIHHGWQFVKEDSTRIQMNKKYSELEEISVSVSNSEYSPYYASCSTASSTASPVNTDIIHITLPIKNSKYSFYKKHTDRLQSIMFLQNYIADIIT